jgi:pimeloyl-ACP methyl ester carboxylesterase
MQPGAAEGADGGPASRWTDNGPVTLHYLEARPSAPGPAVLVVPGFGEEAADHAELVEAVSPRRAIAVDLRGRGASADTTDGYRIEDHVKDLESIVAAAGIERLHLVAYSRGTTYGLAWALGHLGQIASITIGDYPPAQIVPPASLPDTAATRIWKRRPMTDRMSRTSMEAMVGDAVAVEFWDELALVRQPVLLIRGGARGAMVNDAMEDRYRGTVSDLRVVTFEESGHDLWSPDPHRFPATVKSFLDAVEGRNEKGSQ